MKKLWWHEEIADRYVNGHVSLKCLKMTACPGLTCHVTCLITDLSRNGWHHSLSRTPELLTENATADVTSEMCFNIWTLKHRHYFSNLFTEIFFGIIYSFQTWKRHGIQQDDLYHLHFVWNTHISSWHN